MSKLFACVAVALAFAVPAAGASASARTFNDYLTGIEVLPVTSTSGTFTGVAVGLLPGTWRAQIDHDPLSASSANITGGTFAFHSLFGRRSFTADVESAGTVTPSGGDGCKTQTFSVQGVALSDDHGTFNGTLTHYGFMLGGTCVVYSASIRGTWTIGG